MTRGRPEAGFSLLELLIATALTLAISAAMLALVTPARVLFQAGPEVQDLQQRLRVAVETIGSELGAAGAGFDIGPLRGPLAHFLAPVRPYRAGERDPDPARGVHFRPDAVSVLYVPRTTAQVLVGKVVRAGGSTVVYAEPNCGSPRDRVCGFARDMLVLMLEAGGRSWTGTVAAVDGQVLTIEGGPSWEPDVQNGVMLTEVEAHTYWLDVESDPPRLMHYDGLRTDLPAVDQVVAFDLEYFGETRPPLLLRTDVDLSAREGPWTTYGPKPPPSDVDDPRDGWPAGENCTFAMAAGVHVPRLAELPGGPGPIPLPDAMLTDGPWCPDDAAPDRFDADLLRIRRIGVRLRVEAGSAFRGPPGPFFRRSGVASGAAGLVPDQEIRFDVSPRNLQVEK